MIKEEKIEELKKSFSSYYIDFYIKEIEKEKRRNLYEKACEISGKIIPIKFSTKKLKEDIIFSGLNVLPNEVISLSILSFLITFFISFFILKIFPDIGFFIFSIPVGISYILYTYPNFKSKVNKIQTKGESIKIITYLVLYLEYNPNFEAALDFAAKRVKGFLSDDIRKIVWEIRIGQVSSLKEALEKYIPKWIQWDENFVRALILLFSVTYITSTEERKKILSKTLNFILEKNLEETKVYVENIRGPVTILSMFGLLMPSVALVLFPLISVFLHFSVKPSYIIFGYIIILPLLNLFLITRFISLRPGAFLIIDISKHPKLPKYNYFLFKNYLIPIIPLSILIFFSISYFGINHFIEFYSQYFKYYEVKERVEEIIKKENEINIKNILFGLQIPLAFGISMLIYFYLNSFQKVRIREEIKDVENDLPNFLTVLGNFLENGYPLENAIEKTKEEYERLGMINKSGYRFCNLISKKIRSGEDYESAINSSLNFFPSVLLEETMKLLLETVKKSVKSAGNLIKVYAKYIENIFQTDFRLKELLADVRGNLKMQAQYLLPIILAIVSSTGVFIINMLSLLGDWFKKLEISLGIVGFSDVINILVSDFRKVIPLTLLMTVLGTYNSIVIILISILLSGIENGFDITARDYEISENLKAGLTIFIIFSIVSLIVFHQVLSSIKL
jgi:MFS family permease